MGAEVPHGLRACIEEHWMEENFTVDMKNAFNMVCCEKHAYYPPLPNIPHHGFQLSPQKVLAFKIMLSYSGLAHDVPFV